MDEANEAYEERVAARHDALVRDAARYRWLRDGGGASSVRWQTWMVEHWAGVWTPLHGPVMDEAIDSAMRKEMTPNT